MNTAITPETLDLYAYTNGRLLTEAPKGLILFFPGLGTRNMIEEDPAVAVEYARLGLLYAIPYYDPWCWMNPRTVSFVDAVTDAILQQYGEGLPIALTGMSMGGLCALTYAAYAKHTPTVCAVNCPVCDLPLHFSERKDLPRTLYAAFGEADGTPTEALVRHSPLHLARDGRLAACDYHIFHCTEDRQVNLHDHSENLIKTLKENGYRATFYPVLDEDHCRLPSASLEKFNAIPADYLLKRR